MEKNKPNLDLIFNSIWEELNFGATQRKHPFHLCFMATTSSSLTPESRIVILREVVFDKFLLRSNCDLRSSKALLDLKSQLLLSKNLSKTTSRKITILDSGVKDEEVVAIKHR